MKIRKDKKHRRKERGGRKKDLFSVLVLWESLCVKPNGQSETEWNSFRESFFFVKKEGKIKERKRKKVGEEDVKKKRT